MDERKNKMTDQRYREILPMAYMTAAIEKGRQPRPVEVGLCARAIVDAEDENNLAYRVAMATKIHCTIVGVSVSPRRPVTTNTKSPTARSGRTRTRRFRLRSSEISDTAR